ncbi:histidine kinase [Paenibacillus sp. WQ 127069]|uniref:Histidine kinase n=1 Tax=Paenibacillus baimaensis TaxID=2982185 RepID=A0ABT2UDQ0_9BACL|nr:histidine kinase [Paenibacillus sp. WQ 127069]
MFNNRFFSKKSFSHRLVLNLSVIIMLTFCLSGYVSYKIHLKLFTSELSKQFYKANEQAAARLDLQIRDIYRLSNYIVFHPYVQEVLQRSALSKVRESYTQLSDQDELNRLLNQVKNDEPKLYSMYLFDLQDNGFYFSGPSTVLLPLDKEVYNSVKLKLQSTSGDLVWFPMQLPSLVETSGYRNMILAARYMKSKDLEIYGVMVMLFDQSLFSEDLQGLINTENANVFLYDKQDRLVYTDIAKPLDLLPLSALDAETVVEDQGESYLYAKSRSNQVDFKLVSRVSLSDIRDKSEIIFQIAIYLGLLSLLLSAILVTVAGQRLLKPLKQLILGMRRVKEGDFTTQIEIKTEDELAYMGQVFNGMATNINALIKEVYERELSEREAELTALQAQLNPHFLYNTLDTIYWKLYLRDDRETAELVVSLSEMLRYALEPARTQTTLGEEIHQVRNYLAIQSARFSEDLETIIQIDKEVETCQIARLLLQPLVENVFIHAFADKLNGRVLLIKAYRRMANASSSDGENLETDIMLQAAVHNPDMLVIEIIDNGCGIDEGQLAVIREAIEVDSKPDTQDHQREDRPQKRNRVGVRSVLRRIDLIYGSPYRAEIRSIIGQGTTVTLLLPCDTLQPIETARGGERDEGNVADR